MHNRNLFNKYFEEKHYIKLGDNADKFDIVIDETKCSVYREKGILCEKCFNESMIKKMQEFSALERLDFINYQVNKYSDHLGWLRGMRALLYDTEDEFGGFNYKMYLEYQQIIEAGISQLSNPEPNNKTEEIPDKNLFVNQDRIEEIKNITNDKFDLSKLIAYCNEINFCYKYDCYLSVAILTRAIIDHIPPIFNAKDFQNVYGQNGNKSFKEHMAHLDKSSRKIADSYLHNQIRNKESLPNQTQVNFSQDIDVLLAEVCRLLKK